MEPFKKFTGLAALMDRVNVDTDSVIPKQFLRGLGRDGLGKFAFFDWRYLESDLERPNPEFELNLPRYKGATVLVVGDNFGCGSSREHAPWALVDMGFKAMVSTSFADIFYNNSIKNGFLPAVVGAGDLAALISELRKNVGLEITVDLSKRILTTSAGTRFPFQIEPHVANSLEKGLDDIAVTLGYKAKIEEFEDRSKASFPWLG